MTWSSLSWRSSVTEIRLSILLWIANKTKQWESSQLLISNHLSFCNMTLLKKVTYLYVGKKCNSRVRRLQIRKHIALNTIQVSTVIMTMYSHKCPACKHASYYLARGCITATRRENTVFVARGVSVLLEFE